MSHDETKRTGDGQENGSEVASFFDEVAASWSARYSAPTQFQKRLLTVMSWFEREPSKERMLDYGCGSGVFTTEMIRRGSHVTAVDISAKMVDAIRGALDAKELDENRCELELVDSETFDGAYLRSRYDGILCLGVLEYVEQDARLAELLAGCLRPGGFLIVMVPNRKSILRTFERIIFQNPKLFRRLSMFRHLTQEDSYLQYQRHTYTVGELDALMGGSGLVRERAHFFAAPNALSFLEQRQSVGFQVLALYRRPSDDGSEA